MSSDSVTGSAGPAPTRELADPVDAVELLEPPTVVPNVGRDPASVSPRLDRVGRRGAASGRAGRLGGGARSRLGCDGAARSRWRRRRAWASASGRARARCDARGARRPALGRRESRPGAGQAGDDDRGEGDRPSARRARPGPRPTLRSRADGDRRAGRVEDDRRRPRPRGRRGGVRGGYDRGSTPGAIVDARPRLARPGSAEHDRVLGDQAEPPLLVGGQRCRRVDRRAAMVARRRGAPPAAVLGSR